MKRRQWDATTEALIVLEGLKGKPVADICAEHQISQSQYYQWRDQFLAHAGKAFEYHQVTKREARLAQENARLKQLVGGADPGVKKATSCWRDAATVAADRPAG
jgi:transposase